MDGYVGEELRNVQCCTYTVKNYRIPVFFLPKLSETGKPLCWQGISCALQRRDFLSFEEEKVFLLLQGNFFLDVECYISLLYP
jgi:hypothetical protein